MRIKALNSITLYIHKYNMKVLATCTRYGFVN